MTVRWTKKLIAPLDEIEGFGALGEKYCEWMAVNNYSPQTIVQKREHLRYLASWCEVRDITRPEQLTRNLLERYQRHVHHYRKDNGKPLCIETQIMRITVIKTFCKYLVNAGYLDSNPVSEIDLPKRPQKLPKHTLSVSEVEKVMSQPNLNRATGLRDRAILETFYSTAIRRMELANLNTYDIDSERGTLMVRQGKGQKDRVVPIGERALYWVDSYVLEARAELLKQDDHPQLFITGRGRPFLAADLSAIVTKYIKKSEIIKTGSCHIFRHSTATLMLENGADIRHIQVMLGHACLSTTQIYTQVSIKHLKAVHDRTHPGKLDKRIED